MPRISDTETVIHNWAHSRNIDTRNARNSEAYESSNCSRNEAGDLYSYRTRIAKKHGIRLFLFDVDMLSYSKTTSKQMSLARRSSFGTRLYVPNVDPTDTTAHKANLTHLQNEIRSTAYEVLKTGTRSNHITACESLCEYLQAFKTSKKYLTKFWKDLVKQHANRSVSEPTHKLFEADYQKLVEDKKQAAKQKTLETKRAVYNSAWRLWHWLNDESVNPPQSNYRSIPVSMVLNNDNVRELFEAVRDCLAAIAPDNLTSFKKYSTVLEFREAVLDRIKYLTNVYTSEEYSKTYQAVSVLINDNLLSVENAPVTNWQVKQKLSAVLYCGSKADQLPVGFYSSIADLVNEVKPIFDTLPSTWEGYQLTEANCALCQTVSDCFSKLYRPFVEEQNRISDLERIESAKRYEEQKRIEREQLMLDNAQKLSNWRNGANVQLPYDLGYLLRLNGDNVESSRGCKVPVKFARYVWTKLVKYFAFEISAEDLPRQFGAYSFLPDQQNQLREDLRVGCHLIPKAEIISIADQLGLIGPYRECTCLDCNHTFNWTVKSSEHTSNISGEASVYCPRCNRKNVSAGPINQIEAVPC